MSRECFVGIQLDSPFFGVLLQPYYGTVTATTLYAFCGKDVDYIVVVIDVAKYSNAPAIAAVDARSAFCSNAIADSILFYQVLIL